MEMELMRLVLILKHLVKVDIKKLTPDGHFNFIKGVFKNVISVDFIYCPECGVQIWVIIISCNIKLQPLKKC